MRQVWQGLFLSNRFFIGGAISITLFILGFGWSLFFWLGQIVWWGLLVATLVDAFGLFRAKLQLSGRREVPTRMSLGDENTVKLFFETNAKKALTLEVIDELPPQFQERKFSFSLTLKPQDESQANYPLRPVSRGVYSFGQIRAFLTGNFGLAVRRFTFGEPTQEISVYPSVLQMKKYELIASSQLAQSYVVRKLRRIGHSYEFEQIKNYVQGDDYRSLNWKATGRRNQLMVNQYQDERSQQIYAILDKSRLMRMPFEGLTLLDYAINATLVIANLALKKQDKAGLITFSDKLGPRLRATRKKGQLRKILETLYRQKTEFPEANYELLYQTVRREVNGRSLLLLFTNFESMTGLERVLPLLRQINRMHLLVVIMFENTEIEAFAKLPAQDTEEIYMQTVAQKTVIEKQKIAHRLSQYGIQTILTAPEDLSMHTVNKYLELKSRGLI